MLLHHRCRDFLVTAVPRLDLRRIVFRCLGIASRSPSSRDNTAPSRGTTIGIPGFVQTGLRCSSSYWVSKYVISEDDNLPSQTRHKHSAQKSGEENGTCYGRVLATFQRLRVVFYGRSPSILWLSEALGSQGTQDVGEQLSSYL